MKPLFLAIALVLAPTAGLAQTFEFLVKNGYTDALTGLSVSGGKVEGFRQIPANGERIFSVTLKEGKCEASVSVTFANGQYHDAGRFDFCEYNVLNLYFR
jgi:hypothetical protein